LTISHQPLASFEAAIGAKLPGIALYSATACSAVETRISGGSIQQRAEMAKLNVVGPALAIPTGMRSKNKTALSRTVNTLKWAAVATSIIIAAKGVSPGVVQGVTFGAGALQVVEAALTPNTDQAGQVFAGALAQLLNPNDLLVIPAGGCVSRLFFADYVKGFTPIAATIP
jgi:hypothetical protein